MPAEIPQTLEYRGGQLNVAPILKDLQDSSDDEEDTRSSQEYMDDLRRYLADHIRKGLKGLVAEEYEWNEEDVSSDENETTKVKVLMALADDENLVVDKESARNGEWVKISIRNVYLSRREIKPRNLQHVIKICETYGSTVHNTTVHYDIEWFRRGESLQAKNVKALKSKKTGSSKANRFKTPTRWWVSKQN
ncbi:hypothetical protein Tco_0555378 [Tanacetum coccineum]